jgi:hypothetical protein
MSTAKNNALETFRTFLSVSICMVIGKAYSTDDFLLINVDGFLQILLLRATEATR